MKNSRLRTRRPPPPKGLSAEAARWWKKILTDYPIDDQAGLLILQTALEAFDRMRGAQAQIERDGLTHRDRFGQVKSHPLLAAERDARAAVRAGLKDLNLDIEPPHEKPGRPTGT